MGVSLVLVSKKSFAENSPLSACSLNSRVGLTWQLKPYKWFIQHNSSAFNPFSRLLVIKFRHMDSEIRTKYQIIVLNMKKRKHVIKCAHFSL